MQTRLQARYKNTPAGQRAERLLRACVHCGFCNATCPTYQQLGDELDGPRGRIYLIKQLLEGQPPTRSVQIHLDRCLTCLSCETTCPSGVRYHSLLDIGREIVENAIPRPLPERLQRRLLLATLPEPKRFTPLLRLARGLRPLLPKPLAQKISPPQPAPTKPRPHRVHPRRMLLLDGCVQPTLAPNINAAAIGVFDRLGIRLHTAPRAGCCGALNHHLADSDRARRYMRANIDAWLPELDAGAEAIVATASGCGAHLKAYGELLADDPDYAEKAARIAEATHDISEIIAQEDLDKLPRPPSRRIAFHAPCTLQHAQGLHGKVESILQRLGHELTPVPDSHLCCGSAGVYSLLQPDLAHRLRDDKLRNLQSGEPEVIVTANIGCLEHLRGGTTIPVRHWIEEI
ncbi:MAG TPA: glycolate oxidase subunit GlcF [Gammaproteobacteria bacterium]|nr:glycolate oxidase subunit GlcF [Gammaproteobacteria bacterium]